MVKMNIRPFSAVLLLLIILPGICFCAVSCATTPPASAPVPASPAVPEAPPPTDTQSILTAVADLLGRGDFDGALACFDRLDSTVAITSGIRLLKASVLSSAGRTGEARSIVEEIIADEPDNTEALYVLSTLEGAGGKDKEQKAILESLIKIDPNHVQALSSLGDISLREKSLKNAASYFDKVLTMEPNNGNALLGRAGVYRYQRNPKEAEALLNKAVTLYPQWTRPLTERARLYEEAGFYDDALKDLDKAEKLNGNDYWIAIDRGIVLVNLRRKKEALPEFNRAIAMNPNIFLAYVYSAGIKDDLGDYEGAEHDYGVLATLKPEYYFALEGLGVQKMRRGRWAEARDAFLEVYKQAPETHYALLASLCWMRSGKMSDPKIFLETALKKVQRDTMEWYMLRLYHDLNGDNDVAMRIDKETNLALKARMLYYLASYYDIRGNTSLANRYFVQVNELNQRTVLEWRFNKWVVEERNLKVN
jgi:tetratricopeptide (TPR) repeat protein